MSMLQTTTDVKNETEIAAHVEACNPGWTLHHFGSMDAIDWWAEKNLDGTEGFAPKGPEKTKCAALCEIKDRPSERADDYPTTWISVRKWLALLMASQAFDVPAYYVIRFACGTVKWIDVNDVPTNHERLQISWRTTRDVSNDKEPMVRIYVSAMDRLVNGD